MAILPNLPGIEAKVIMEGVQCHEYHNPDDPGPPDQNHVVSYIQSEVGAAFAISFTISRNCKLAEQKNDVQFDIFVDGSQIPGYVLQNGMQHSVAKDYTIRIEGARVMTAKGAELRRFRFAKLSTDDRALPSADSVILKEVRDLGDITLKLYRTTVIGPNKPALSTEFKPRELDIIPEKALKGKALSQHTQLDHPESTATFSTVSSSLVDPITSPLASFSFRYRSLSDLKALMIIPRSPSPVSLEDRRIEDLTPAELRELLQRERERNANIKKEQNVKRERSNTIVIDDENEASNKRRKEDIETIDLT